MMRYDTTPDAPFILPFYQYQPDPTHAEFAPLWDSQVRLPAHLAVPQQPQNKAITAFDAVTQTTQEHLDGVIREAFQAGDRAQRDLVDALFGVLPADQTAAAPLSSASPVTEPAQPVTEATLPIRVQSGRLNTTTCITLGEGLAAGMGNGGLESGWDLSFGTRAFLNGNTIGTITCDDTVISSTCP